jgi:hypothetical protein
VSLVNLHKDTISNGRCVVIGEIYGTNNIKRASKEIVDATTQMSSQYLPHRNMGWNIYLNPDRNYIVIYRMDIAVWDMLLCTIGSSKQVVRGVSHLVVQNHMTLILIKNGESLYQ